MCGNKVTALLFLILLPVICWAGEIKVSDSAGTFYPADAGELSRIIDTYLDAANPQFPKDGEIIALIAPHAGYGFSGPSAAFAYKLIRAKPYKTVVVLASSHFHSFNGAAIWPSGAFRTPLGDLEVDAQFSAQLLDKDAEFFSDNKLFTKEHGLEVQLPFIQKTLSAAKIVPILMGDLSYLSCIKLADMLKAAIGERKDVLVIASTDMAHRYDFAEVERTDKVTLDYLSKMDFEGLYNGFREGKTELCGSLPVVTALLLAKKLGHDKIFILHHTNSAEVTGVKQKGLWTVGYVSAVIDNDKAEASNMLNSEQRKRLLEIARLSIAGYLKNGQKISVTSDDKLLNQEMGAFVTLHENGELRGCIGNLIGKGPLYLTVRDMAIEAAVGDPRFNKVEASELADIKIEISVLSPMERIDSADKIIMGKHGVLIRRGFNSGVYLPQVATETGWSKEEFLSSLCAHKAGLSADAWKDPKTEIYIFSAEVFEEK